MICPSIGALIAFLHETHTRVGDLFRERVEEDGLGLLAAQRGQLFGVRVPHGLCCVGAAAGRVDKEAIKRQ